MTVVPVEPVTKLNDQTASAAKKLEVWRLCSSYSVAQAALLVVGQDPAAAVQVESVPPHERPAGYEGAKQAIEQALKKDSELGWIFYLDKTVEYPGYHEPIDPLRSTIGSSGFKGWLTSRDLNIGLFSDRSFRPRDAVRPDYLNRTHPRYSAKLAAAIEAWEAVGPRAAKSKISPRKNLVHWLRENADKFEPAGSEGRLTEKGIQEAASVANWNLRGGAPSTRTNQEE